MHHENHRDNSDSSKLSDKFV